LCSVDNENQTPEHLTPDEAKTSSGTAAAAPRLPSRQGVLAVRIRDLFEVRNNLLDCTDVPTLSEKGLALVREKLRSQTASLFLFGKDGYLKRVGVRGIDKNGLPIEDSWYADERYRPGESFTGRAVVPAGGSPYGEPQWTNDLEREPADPQSHKAYYNRLGFLKCAITVPLNGRHLTFGALEVINKLGKNGRPHKQAKFRLDDVYWLSVIGMSIASAVTTLRRQDELKLLSEISEWLLEPFGDGFSTPKIYSAMADRLSGPASHYCACIIRVVDDTGMLMTAGRASDSIPWDGGTELGKCVVAGEGIAGGVCQSGVRVVYEDVSEHADEFKHYGWVRRHELVSYACIPLKVHERTVGTLSLFTRYRHKFYPSDLTFLDNIAAQIAAVTESVRVVSRLHKTTAEIATGAERGKRDALAAGFEGGMTSYVHKYKNDLLNFQKGFEEMRLAKTARRASIAWQHIQQIELLLKEIAADISATRSRVNVNRLVQDIVRFYSMDPKSSGIAYAKNLDVALPDLEVREGDLRTIIDNLVTNAIKAIQKASRPQGAITVITARVRLNDIDYLQLTVTDNGVGIRNEDDARVYVRGYTTYPGGTGEGLFLIKRLVESSFGGSIQFNSTVGKGTTFTVRIPLLRYEWKEEEI
jgi:anti-sigma regulatory factor (Ser/Thr protein kinase)/putative methionine-R-sulfoxide reductase with GAF domain